MKLKNLQSFTGQNKPVRGKRELYAIVEIHVSEVQYTLKSEKGSISKKESRQFKILNDS